MFRNLCLLLAINCIGCIPLPHTSTIAPAIGGAVILEDGTPVAGASIDYSLGRYSETTLTNEEGHFTIGPLLQWHWLVYIGSPGRAPFPDTITYVCRSAEIVAACSNCQTLRLRLGQENLIHAQSSIDEIESSNYCARKLDWLPPEAAYSDKLILRVRRANIKKRDSDATK